MPIASGDLLFKLSTTAGASGNAGAQADPNASLGKFISTTQIVDATLNNLFDDISGDENAASTIDYRCMFIHNAHASLTLQGAKCWISAEVAGGASGAIALDASGVVTLGAAGQAQFIADETTAPTGLSFSAPTTKPSGLTIGDIPAGSCQAIWVKRLAANTVAVDADGLSIRIEGDSSA